ncbi:hypothetical protein [Kitasatospora sp. NPDC050463]|uniref:hypothetical protein n=1 Tax=Kitasatospora sp. NPDC050463 TaxID=3155786 RepID=UPI0033E9D19A
MSRGRHRHSSVLGRVLPPTAAGVLIVAAVAALLFSQDTVLVRSVGVAAVLAALGIAVLLRQRDRAARAAAEVSVAQRLRAEERFEEQLAEAEYAAEVAEERATRFGRRLTAEKSRLAKAETEIARLLRERAVAVAEQALKEAEATQRALAAARPKYPASPAAFLRAAAVLRHLGRQAAARDAQRERAAGAEVAVRARTAPAHVPAVAAPARPVPAPVAPAVPTPAASRPAVVAPAPAPRPALTATVGQLGGQSGGTPGTPVVAAERQRPRPQQARGQGFSFFGRSGATGRPAAPAQAVGSVAELGERTDLADVVGDEAVAAAKAGPVAVVQGRPQPPVEQVDLEPEVERDEAEQAGGERPGAGPAVVDLTPDDETELLQLPELRASR